ncbi:MAG: hypothetical protein ABI794_08435 [Betaproteobacteria bacterium]
MMLRLAIILAVIGLILIALTPRKDAATLERRGKAMAIAMRQTVYTVAAVGFTLLTGFGLWHGFGHDDRTALTLAVIAAPLALVFGWLAWRAQRRPARR